MSRTIEASHSAVNLKPVDRLEIVVLIDNKTDSLSSVPAGTTLEWTNLAKVGMKQIGGGCQCCANHGLALIVTAHRGNQKKTILFDAGPVEFTVEYNGKRLGTRFSEIDAVMLSHGHWDHAGGLPRALDLIKGNTQRSDIPCYFRPGMFRKRALPLPGGGLLPIRDIPTPEDLVTHGGNPVITDEPLVVLQGMFFVSGEIVRITSYKKGFPGHMRRTEDDLDWEPDPLILDERFLAVHVNGKGIVVFSAYSHAGIINVLHSARKTFSNIPLYAVAGGLFGPGMR